MILETVLGGILALIAATGLAMTLSRFSRAMECRNDALQAALRVRTLKTEALPKNAGRDRTHTWIDWPCFGSGAVRISLPHLEPENESPSL